MASWPQAFADGADTQSMDPQLDKPVPRFLRDWRYCPYCASGLIARQIEPDAQPHVECVSGSCPFKYFANPFPTATTIIVSDKGVLLTQRAANPHAGSWCLPGGFLDVGEGSDEAAAREADEETKLTIDPTQMQIVAALPDVYNAELGITTINLYYVVHVKDALPEPGSDALAVGWFDPEDVLHRLRFDSQIEAYDKWMQTR